MHTWERHYDHLLWHLILPQYCRSVFVFWYLAVASIYWVFTMYLAPCFMIMISLHPHKGHPTEHAGLALSQIAPFMSFLKVLWLQLMIFLSPCLLSGNHLLPSFKSSASILLHVGKPGNTLHRIIYQKSQCLKKKFHGLAGLKWTHLLISYSHWRGPTVLSLGARLNETRVHSQPFLLCTELNLLDFYSLSPECTNFKFLWGKNALVLYLLVLTFDGKVVTAY